MNKAIRDLLLSVFEYSGVNKLSKFFCRNRILILWYHGVCDDGFDLLKGYDERHIPLSLFRQQLAYFKKNKYTFISLSDIPEIMSKRKKVRNPVVLTFDDGFKNVITKAYPVILEFGAKGCIYLVTDLVGTENLLWTDYIETIIRNYTKKELIFIYKGNKFNYEIGTKEQSEFAMLDIKARLRKLTDIERKKHLKQFEDIELGEKPTEFLMADWGDLREIDPKVLEIGCHTRRHPNCDALFSDAEMEDEINNSKEKIERMLKLEVKHFCYPAGAYNENVVKYVEKCGYTTATTVENGLNGHKDNLFKLKRVFVDEDYVLFKAHVSGFYFFIKRIFRK